MDEARAALGLTAGSYTDPTLTVGVTTVKAVHIQKLRQRVTEALATNSTDTSYDTATNRITTAGITYDAAGQTLTDALFCGLQYQYNPEGRMIWSANLDASNPSTYVYDGLGQRVQTTQAGVTKRYFYDINGSVVAEYEATGGTGYGALKRLNVSAGGRLLAVDEVQTDGSKVTSYLMVDRQGSTRVLMNAAGAVTSRHDYLPFGEELGAGTGAPGSPTGMRTAAQGYSAADNVRQRYADTRLDDATGLDHTLWRKLETRNVRWTTPDPYGKSLRVGNPQSFNRYAYVFSDPVNFADRNGLDSGYIVNGPCPNVGSCNVNVLITFQGAVGSGSGGSGLGDGFEIVNPVLDETTGGPMDPPVDPEKPLDNPDSLETKPKPDCGIAVSFKAGPFREGMPTGPVSTGGEDPSLKRSISGRCCSG